MICLINWGLKLCAVHYQSVLSCLVMGALCFYLFRSGSRPPPPPAPAPAQPVDAPPSPTPYLWTQDNSPIYGSPIYRRSPQSQVIHKMRLLFYPIFRLKNILGRKLVCVNIVVFMTFSDQILVFITFYYFTNWNVLLIATC